ncbi:hypothetical protein ACFWNN_12185 [Lentzea sp. NPDC058450]|uniref:hypothetical protein n=1 Tax=Lentzea sp. NPDC058450 TaxID=3346505 RepID=UPI003646DF2B
MGGGSGFSGLHGQPDGVGVVVVVSGGAGGGASGFVAAGGGVVFFGCCWVLDGALLSAEDEGALLLGVEVVVELLDLGVELVQVDAGVLLCGSSPAAPWIAMPTSTPSNADPSTAEPPAAHSARTAVLL